jgi:phage tail tape-measure protein
MTATTPTLRTADAIRAARSLTTPIAAARCADDHQEAHRLSSLGMDLVDQAMTAIEDGDPAIGSGRSTADTYAELGELFTRFELARQDARRWL